jgi:hypothetical protein
LRDKQHPKYCDVHAVGQQSQQKKDVAWQRTRTQQWEELLFSTGSGPAQRGSVFFGVRAQDVGSAGGPGPWRDSAETVQWNTS